MSKPYFPNNWEQYKDTPASEFMQHTYEEVMEWKVGSWELPSSVACIMRVYNRKSGKIKEYTYQRMRSAEEKLAKLIQDPDAEIVVADHGAIHMLTNVTDDD